MVVVMKTRITELLGVKYPIIQGGMAWVAEAKLAAAVSNAGGVGLIAGGNAPAEVIREDIRKAKEMTDKPFGVNIMMISPYADDLAQLVCEEKLAVVTTGAGNPAKYAESFKNAGVKFIPVVPSVAGLYGNAGQFNYSASKAGVVGMTLTAAKELGKRNITVNAVAPGFIETPMTDVLDEKVKEAIKGQIALGRYGKPEEVASTISFLASEDASYISGQVIVIDGCLSM